MYTYTHRARVHTQTHARARTHTHTHTHTHTTKNRDTAPVTNGRVHLSQSQLRESNEENRGTPSWCSVVKRHPCHNDTESANSNSRIKAWRKRVKIGRRKQVKMGRRKQVKIPEVRSCGKVVVAVLSSPSLIVLIMNQHTSELISALNTTTKTLSHLR